MWYLFYGYTQGTPKNGGVGRLYNFPKSKGMNFGCHGSFHGRKNVYTPWNYVFFPLKVGLLPQKEMNHLNKLLEFWWMIWLVSGRVGKVDCFEVSLIVLKICGWATHLKNMCPQTGTQVHNTWNHHPVFLGWWVQWSWRQFFNCWRFGVCLNMPTVQFGGLYGYNGYTFWRLQRNARRRHE